MKKTKRRFLVLGCICMLALLTACRMNDTADQSDGNVMEDLVDDVGDGVNDVVDDVDDGVNDMVDDVEDDVDDPVDNPKEDTEIAPDDASENQDKK